MTSLLCFNDICKSTQTKKVIVTSHVIIFEWSNATAFANLTISFSFSITPLQNGIRRPSQHLPRQTHFSTFSIQTPPKPTSCLCTLLLLFLLYFSQDTRRCSPKKYISIVDPRQFSHSQPAFFFCHAANIMHPPSLDRVTMVTTTSTYRKTSWRLAIRGGDWKTLGVWKTGGTRISFKGALSFSVVDPLCWRAKHPFWS